MRKEQVPHTPLHRRLVPVSSGQKLRMAGAGLKQRMSAGRGWKKTEKSADRD